MTIKYESELLFDLMKRDGDDAPSDVLPYESELKEKYLEQVKGAYPKLQDYQPEWLYYNLYHHIPSEFPVESVSNVTNATFENVVPYAYKSAILKGQTVSNLWEKMSDMIAVQQQQDGTTIQYDYSEQYGKVTIGEKQVNAATTIGMNTTQQLQGDKTYYINTFVLDGSETDTFLIRDAFNNVNLETTLIKGYPTGQILSFTTKAPTSSLLFYYFAYTRTYGEVNYGKPYYMPKRFIVSDKLEDVVNQDFFEGMQSVKMPVLTTTGKNLFDGELEYGNFLWSNGTKSESKTIIRNVNPIKVNTSNICLSSTSGDIRDTQYVFQYDENMNFIRYRTISNGQVTLEPNTCYINIRTQTDGGNGYVLRPLDDYKIQIEDGSTATPYEPYKSNILTVNEDVTLRGIGDVQDTLDLTTGELTENLIEVSVNSETKLNGYAQTISSHTKTSRFSILLKNTFNVDVESGYGLCDKIPYMNNDSDVFHFKIGDAKNYCFIYIPISELKTNDWDGFVEWAKNLDFKLVLKRSEKSIKTVDLTVVDQDGNETELRTFDDTTHVLLNSEGLIPTAELTVKTKIPSASSTSLLMNDISTKQEQLETTVDEQSNNVDATMIATTEIFEETL